jgi:hypothetical protein
MPVTAMKLWEACRQAKQSRAGDEVQSMIRKSGNRFSEKIMLHQ